MKTMVDFLNPFCSRSYAARRDKSGGNWHVERVVEPRFLISKNSTPRPATPCATVRQTRTKSMNDMTRKLIRIAALLAMTLALGSSSFAQPNATWNNGAADNNWNTAGNWDIGVPAEGTNAIINVGNTVNY